MPTHGSLGWCSFSEGHVVCEIIWLLIASTEDAWPVLVRGPLLPVALQGWCRRSMWALSEPRIEPLPMFNTRSEPERPNSGEEALAAMGPGGAWASSLVWVRGRIVAETSTSIAQDLLSFRGRDDLDNKMTGCFRSHRDVFVRFVRASFGASK